MKSQQEIKSAVEGIYREMKNNHARLEAIRNLCEHPNVSEKLYSWREGSMLPADVCDDCGHLIKLKFPESVQF